MQIKPFCIGISGLAGAGKDSLCDYIIKILPNIQFEKYSLAYELKKDLKDFCQSRFNISPFTTDRDKKNLIRPILVEVARVNRTVSNKKYYTNILQSKIDDAIFNNKIPIVTDIRYYESPEDEAPWIKNNNGVIIHIRRKLENGKFIKPPNEEEKRNDPKVRASADLKLTVPTLPQPQLDEWLDTNVKSKIINLIKKHVT